MTVRKLKAVPSSVEVVAKDKDLLKALVKEALEQILQTEMTDFLGAGPGERSEGRSGPRKPRGERAESDEEPSAHDVVVGIVEFEEKGYSRLQKACGSTRAGLPKVHLIRPLAVQLQKPVLIGNPNPEAHVLPLAYFPLDPSRSQASGIAISRLFEGPA
jgi:hypothetical protein